ncbi:unnamed protein product [Adineta steineri]|uniref:Tetratricopeptide repeat protein 21B n=1 Tax=Adineta steineri TaxID=433720 RepID=A0A813ZPQ1_9BILA|nr:unnamed protein product [Adineta steineri]
MAEKDLYNLSKIFYYFREKYYNQAYVSANEGLKRFVNDGILKFYSALAQLMNARLNESMRELEQLRIKPELSVATLIALIYAHKQHKTQDREAITEYESKVKELRKQADDVALFYAAHTLYITGKPDKATEYIDRATKQNQTNFFASSLKGWILIATDVPKESKQYFEAALKLESNFPDAAFGYAKYREIRSNFSQALEYVNRVLATRSDYLPAVLENMKLQLCMQDWEQCEDVAQRAFRIDSNCVEAHKYHYLYLICKEGNYSDAQQAFTQLLQALDISEPRGAWQYYEISQVVARVCGRNPQILHHSDTLLQRALEMDSANTEYLIEAGYQALMGNKINDAIKFYKTAGKTQADSIAAVYGIIHCQILEGKYNDARQQIEFQNEVQTANTSELAHLKALLAKNENVLPADQIVHLFDIAAEQHFKNLRGLPLGKKYLLCLNPDFILEIIREYMVNTSSQPIEPGQTLDPCLRKASGILEQLTRAVPGLLEGLFLLAKVKYLSGEMNEAKATLRRIIDQEATYSDAYILLAQVHTREGNINQAYESLEHGLSYNFDLKTHPLYHLIRARILKKEKKYEEACKLLQSALNLTGIKKRQETETLKTPRSKSDGNTSSIQTSIQDRASVYLELAEIQLLLNRVHEASILLQEASSEFQGTSEESRILLTNVDLALKRGDINQAIETLLQIKSDQAYYVPAREKLAEIYLKHRRDKKLYIKTYKELVDRDPTPQALVILGDAYMSIMEPEKAIEVYDAALRQNNRDVTLMKKIGEAYIKTHAYNKAIKYYEAIVKAEPQSELRINLADLLSKLNQIEQAQKILEQLLKEEVPNTNFQHAQQVTKAYEIIANMLEQSKQFEETKQYLIKAKDNQKKLLKRLQLEEGDVLKDNQKLYCNICYRLATMYFDEQNYEAAIKDLKEASAIDDRNLKIQMMLAKAYLNSEQYELCEQICTYMIKTFPNDNSVQIMMANHLLRKNEIEKAIQQYKDIIERNPNNFDPFVQMTKSLYRAGRLDEISDILEKTEKNNLRAYNDAAFNFAKGLLSYYLCKPSEALSCFNKCRRDKQYGRQAVYAMVKIVLNPDNEIIANEDDWKRRIHGARSDEVKTAQATALNLLQSIGAGSNDIRYKVLENWCLAYTGEKSSLEQAAENLSQILNDHKDNIGALCAISECFIGLKNVQKARQYLKKTTKITWNMDDADELEQCWLMLAMTYVQATKYDEALELCKKVLHVNKCSTRALETLGMMNEQTGAHNDAAENYEQAWKYSRKNQPSIGYKLAFSYLKSKRLTDAIDIAHFILQRYPDNTRVRKDILEKARLALK